MINEEQAKIVRRIYGLFLQGRSPYAIAKILMVDGIPSPCGKENWSGSKVKSILTNEKYKGDALLQKVYTVDFLFKKKKVNEGEVPQYYVESNHYAIISPQEFDAVQKQMTVRHSGKNRQSCVSTFSSKIKCDDCGSWYGSKVWHSISKYIKTTEKQVYREKIEMFLAGLQKQEDLVTGFDEDLWYSLIEYVTVFNKEDVCFIFKDGTEIRV